MPFGSYDFITFCILVSMCCRNISAIHKYIFIFITLLTGCVVVILRVVGCSVLVYLCVNVRGTTVQISIVTICLKWHRTIRRHLLQHINPYLSNNMSQTSSTLAISRVICLFPVINVSNVYFTIQIPNGNTN